MVFYIDQIVPGFVVYYLNGQAFRSAEVQKSTGLDFRDCLPLIFYSLEIGFLITLNLHNFISTYNFK